MKRRTSNLLRLLMDNWLPPVVRERWPFPWLVKLWLGSSSLPDFKNRAFTMTDAQYVAAYKTVGGAYSNRQCDTTEKQVQWLLDHINPGQKLLEIGPGNKKLTNQLTEQGYNVTTLDLYLPNGFPCNGVVIGVAERLPFPNKSFDTIIMSHVLEHVRSLTLTFLELERVARKRVLIVTPRQRFYKVTFDYHLHFFYSLDHLASHVHTGTTSGKIIDGDLCLLWRVEGQSRKGALENP